MKRTCLLSATHPCLLPRLSSSSWTCVCITHANRDHRKGRGWGAQPTKPFPFPCSFPPHSTTLHRLPCLHCLPRHRGSTNTPSTSSYRQGTCCTIQQIPGATNYLLSALCLCSYGVRSAIPPYHHPLAARLGHLVISVFESPSDLGALRPTSSYQQVPCWTTEVPYLPTYARFLSASDEHGDCQPHDLTRPFLSVPRSSENSNMSASPYLGTGGMLVSGKSTFG